jgi:hypothetical protein
MKHLILTIIFSVAVGLTNLAYSQEQGKVEAVFEIFDLSTWTYKYSEGVVEYEIKKSIGDGKPYYNLTHYAYRSPLSGEIVAGDFYDNCMLVEKENTIKGVKYSYFAFHDQLNGTRILVK